MSQPPVAEVTLGEIVRTLQGLQEDIRALRGEHVRRDLYEAHRTAMEASVARVGADCNRSTERLQARLDASEQDRANAKRQLNLTLISAGVSLIVAILGIFLR